jgi:hypothetical protein
MQQQLEWPPLEERRKTSRIGLMYKINRNLVNIATKTRLSPAGRISKNSHTLAYHLQSTKTDTRHNSVFPKTIRDWNKWCTGTVTAETLATFKRQIAIIDN